MAAPYTDLDDVYVPPLAAPKVENATRIGITIRPAFPRVASPNGCRGIGFEKSRITLDTKRSVNMK